MKILLVTISLVLLPTALGCGGKAKFDDIALKNFKADLLDSGLFTEEELVEFFESGEGADRSKWNEWWKEADQSQADMMKDLLDDAGFRSKSKSHNHSKSKDKSKSETKGTTASTSAGTTGSTGSTSTTTPGTTSTTTAGTTSTTTAGTTSTTTAGTTSTTTAGTTSTTTAHTTSTTTAGPNPCDEPTGIESGFEISNFKLKAENFQVMHDGISETISFQTGIVKCSAGGLPKYKNSWGKWTSGFPLKMLTVACNSEGEGGWKTLNRNDPTFVCGDDPTSPDFSWDTETYTPTWEDVSGGGTE